MLVRLMGKLDTLMPKPYQQSQLCACKGQMVTVAKVFMHRKTSHVVIPWHDYNNYLVYDQQ